MRSPIAFCPNRCVRVLVVRSRPIACCGAPMATGGAHTVVVAWTLVARVCLASLFGCSSQCKAQLTRSVTFEWQGRRKVKE